MLLRKGKNLESKVEFKLHTIDRGHHQVTYRKVKCIKSPFDYVMYQMIVSELEPDLIIEIGSNEGGSALYLADLLEIIGKGVVHSIDIDDRRDERVKDHPRIHFFHEGWENYNMELVKDYEVVLIIEDSSHTYENTLKVMNRFAPAVSSGSYLIVEDGIIDALGRSKEFGGGPVKAIKEFLSKNSNFTIDERWCDFFGKNATFNTLGYLKRNF